MNDEGRLFMRRLMVQEGAKNPHWENGLMLGASMCLVDGITVGVRIRTRNRTSEARQVRLG